MKKLLIILLLPIVGCAIFRTQPMSQPATTKQCDCKCNQKSKASIYPLGIIEMPPDSIIEKFKTLRNNRDTFYLQEGGKMLSLYDTASYEEIKQHGGTTLHYTDSLTISGGELIMNNGEWLYKPVSIRIDTNFLLTPKRRRCGLDSIIIINQ